MHRQLLDRLHESEGTVLLAVTAPWCGPCKALKPALTALKHEGVHVMTADIETPEGAIVAQSLGVSGVPAMIRFDNGVPTADLRTGVTPAKIRAMLG